MAKHLQLSALLGLILSCVFSIGCTETLDGPTAELEITGDYLDEWGGLHTIENNLWSISFEGSASSLFHVEQYDNDTRELFTLNDENNEWSGGLYSRFDWVWSNEGTLYFCQTTYDAPTLTDAKETTPPDTFDLMGSGCAGFSWTALDPL